MKLNLFDTESHRIFEFHLSFFPYRGSYTHKIINLIFVIFLPYNNKHAKTIFSHTFHIFQFPRKNSTHLSKAKL